MKTYVKIENAGATNRRSFEVFGFGESKRNTKDAIGKFRSGAKIAAAMAQRLGLEIIITSAPEDGAYVLEFETYEEKVVTHLGVKTEKMLLYKYSDGRVFEPSVALSAFYDWNWHLGYDKKSEVYSVLREFLANARDEDPDYNMEFGVSEITPAKKGRTAVYIEQTPEVLDILCFNPDPFFKFLGEPPILEIPGAGAIYPKANPEEMRFFACGYLISCDKVVFESLYDYDIYDGDLFTEQRSLKDRERYFGGMAKIIAGMDESSFDILDSIIQYACETDICYEHHALRNITESSEDFKKMCLRIWRNLHGEKAVLSSGDSLDDADVKGFHRKIISLPIYMGPFFQRMGIKDSREERKKIGASFVARPPAPEEYKRFENIYDRYLRRVKYYRGVKDCPWEVFEDLSDMPAAGFALNYEKIAVNKNEFNDKSDANFLKTVLHEFRHVISKKPDHDFRGFMKFADIEITYLIILLSVTLDALEKMGVKLSELCPEFVDEEDKK